MRGAFLGVVILAGLVPPAAAQDRRCCDLWIFQTGASGAESYAVQVRGSGRTAVAELALDSPARFVADPAARTLVRGWIAASHRPENDSILIDGRDARLRIGPLERPAPGAMRDGDTLIYVRHVTPAQARDFVDDIDDLPPAMASQMKALIPE